MNHDDYDWMYGAPEESPPSSGGFTGLALGTTWLVGFIGLCLYSMSEWSKCV